MLRIYKSSAGSGKTYTLVREFIRIALKRPNNFRHILAITFTNKAANEMKERVISKLEQLSDGKDKLLVADLAGETGVSETKIAEKAGATLQNILHNYSELSVSTIDSFTHRVVRSFAYDLYLPMNFDVEMDGLKLLTETVEILMDRLAEEDEVVTSAIVEYAEANIEDGKSWNIEHSLISLAHELFNEDAYPYLDRLEDFDLSKTKNVREELYRYSTAFEQRVFEEGKKALSLITTNGLTSQSFFQTTKGIFGFFFKYANSDFPGDKLGNSYVRKTITENKWGGGKASTGDIETIEIIKPQLIAHYNSIVQYFEKQGQDYILSKLLLRNFYSFILLTEIRKLMNEYKRENNLLHISEFQKKIHAIVREQDAPVIYERIGEKYENILIDEHQDTSELQWQNLVPLVENAQFNNGNNLVVGDGKQGIYRFRGGKVEQFAMLPNIYGSDKDERLREREVAIKNYGVEIKSLEFNRRSRREIVDFNNLFYSALSGLSELVNKEVYAGQEQKQGKDATGGYVQIQFLEDDQEAVLDEHRCKRSMEIIEECLKKGYAWRDIAILTRSNRNGSIVASYLIGKGIRVISSESLLIDKSPKVQLILSTLNYLDRRDNPITKAAIIYYLHLLLKNDSGFAQYKFHNNEAVFEREVSALTGKEFVGYNFQNYPLVEMIHELIVFFNLSDDDPFLQFFLDETMVFASRNRTNIREFLDWWNEVKAEKSIIYPETLDAVKIMTIHKSKGLQFPVVIMADADWPQKRAKRNFWVELNKPWLKDLPIGILPVSKDVLETEFAALYQEEEAGSFLDMLNLLYVATTRPEDTLFILSTQGKNEPVKNNSVTALLINFLKQQGRWEGFLTYSFGDEGTVKTPDGRPGEGKMYEKKPVFTASREVRQVTIRKNSQLLWNEETVEKINWGSLVHEALRQIKYSADADSVVNKMFNEGTIDLEQKGRLQQQVSIVINNAAIETYFNLPWKVINERGFLSKETTRVPDRIVINDKNAVIIDYKTGAKNQGHIQQLAEYALELKKFGFDGVKKYLVYTEANEVQEA